MNHFKEQTHRHVWFNDQREQWAACGYSGGKVEPSVLLKIFLRIKKWVFQSIEKWERGTSVGRIAPTAAFKTLETAKVLAIDAEMKQDAAIGGLTSINGTVVGNVCLRNSLVCSSLNDWAEHRGKVRTECVSMYIAAFWKNMKSILGRGWVDVNEQDGIFLNRLWLFNYAAQCRGCRLEGLLVGLRTRHSVGCRVPPVFGLYLDFRE